MRKEGCSDAVYIADIMEAIEEIIDFSSDGVIDKKTERAIERNIEIIGESAKKISPELKAKYPKIEWREIISMRNMLAHEYHRIDANTVINVATNEIFTLKDQIEKIQQNLKTD